MIATLLGDIAATPWMRAALRYGAITLTIVLFLLSTFDWQAASDPVLGRMCTVTLTNDREDY